VSRKARRELHSEAFHFAAPLSSETQLATSTVVGIVTENSQSLPLVGKYGTTAVLRLKEGCPALEVDDVLGFEIVAASGSTAGSATRVVLSAVVLVVL